MACIGLLCLGFPLRMGLRLLEGEVGGGISPPPLAFWNVYAALVASGLNPKRSRDLFKGWYSNRAPGRWLCFAFFLPGMFYQSSKIRVC